MTTKFKNLFKVTLLVVLVLALFGATFLAASVFAAEENTQPDAAIISWTGEIDTAWYTNDTTATSYTISTPEQLAGVASLVNAGTTYFKNKVIELDADINLGNLHWTPIGYSNTRAFQGEFDGNGHTVSNLYFDGSLWANKGGLFGQIGCGGSARHGAYLHDFTIFNATFVNVSKATGVVVGTAFHDNVLENITVDTATLTGNTPSSAIANGVQTSQFKNILAKDVTINANKGGEVGGMFTTIQGQFGASKVAYYASGYCLPGTVVKDSDENATNNNVLVSYFENCDAQNLTVNVKSAGSYVGGFASYCLDTLGGDSTFAVDCNISNLQINIISGTTPLVGGFIGLRAGVVNKTYTNIEGKTVTVGGFDGCSVQGEINGLSGTYGGFIAESAVYGGSSRAAVTYTDATSNMKIVASEGATVGGFIGYVNTHTNASNKSQPVAQSFDGCNVEGTTQVGDSQPVGSGFIGSAKVASGAAVTIDDCEISGLDYIDILWQEAYAADNSLDEATWKLQKTVEMFIAKSDAADLLSKVTINTTITFDMSVADAIDPITQNIGQTVTKPQDPSVDGYIFYGWYADEQFQTEFNFDASITEDTTVYAKILKVVATVGSTQYTSIDEAIANWTNNTTLTLCDNVTLSNVVKLKSTESHTLNLGTYTMTAASGQHAIEITCEGRSGPGGALTVNADATNPGGINAPGKACFYYKKVGTAKDRPIITINNGVYNGSYSVNFTSNGNTNCPQVVINNGTFNAYMNITKCLLIIRGGYFDCSINATGDTNAYRQISGGTFKNFQFLTTGSGKLSFGTSKTTYDVGVHLDENGYWVVGGPVISEPGTMEASMKGTSFNSFLTYSSAKDTFYAESAQALMTAKPNATITVYKQELDMTNSSFKGTILVPTGNNLVITYAEGTTPTWKVSVADTANFTAVYTDTVVDGKVVRTYEVKPISTVTFDTQGGSAVDSVTLLTGDIVGDIVDPTKEGYTFTGWYTDATCATGTEWNVAFDAVTANITLYAGWSLNEYVITYNYGDCGVETATAFHFDVLNPATPAYQGYVFTGWYADGSYQTPFDFTATVSGETTLYARLISIEEIENRVADLENAKTQLQTAIDTKASADDLAQAVTSLTTAINNAQATAEAAAESKDATLKADLEEQLATAQGTLQTAVDQVASDLEAAKSQLQAAIDTKASADNLSQAVADLTTAINNAQAMAEATAESKDTALKADLEAQLATAQSALQTAVDQVASDLEAAKAQLQVAIDTKASAEELSQAVANLTTAINNAQATAEATAESKDAVLKQQLEDKIYQTKTDLSISVNNLKKDLEGSVEKLVESLETKVDKAEMQSSIAGLQSQIDALEIVEQVYIDQQDAAIRQEIADAIANANQQAAAALQQAIQQTTAQFEQALDQKVSSAELTQAVQNLTTSVELAKTFATESDAAIKAELQQLVESTTQTFNQSVLALQGDLSASKTELSQAIAAKADAAEVQAKLDEVYDTLAALQVMYNNYMDADQALKEELLETIDLVKQEIIAMIVAGDKANADKLAETEEKLAQVEEKLSNQAKTTMIVAALAVLCNVVLAIVVVCLKGKRGKAAVIPAGTKTVKLNIKLNK